MNLSHGSKNVNLNINFHKIILHYSKLLCTLIILLLYTIISRFKNVIVNDAALLKIVVRYRVIQITGSVHCSKLFI